MFALQHIAIVVWSTGSEAISAVIKELQSAPIPRTANVRSGCDTYVPQLAADVVLKLVIELGLRAKPLDAETAPRAVSMSGRVRAQHAISKVSGEGQVLGVFICEPTGGVVVVGHRVSG